MNLWIDAQISPALAPWIERNFPGWTARSLKFLGLRDSPDLDVFWAAREHGAVILSKDGDFAELLQIYGAPPKVIWLTCGNTSNAYLHELLIERLPRAFEMLLGNESLIEIR